MENYLENINNLKACYQQYSFDQVMNMKKEEIRYLCINEKIKTIRNITSDSLLTSNLIHERIRILHDREKKNVEKRRELLDKKFS